MGRSLTVGGAQLGPISREEDRGSVVARMLDLMREAKGKGCDIVVFPELALTTFFPRWLMDDQAEIDRFFEENLPSPATQPLFDAAKDLGIGFYLGYGEIDDPNGTRTPYNSSVYVSKAGEIVAKYRKVHLPGHKEYDPDRKWQHLEKRYFEVGDRGFPVWRSEGAILGMCLCNDRRWPETWRVMGLQGVELVMLGYNTPAGNGISDIEAPHTRMFHNHLSMQAGAYQNATWVCGVAKAGREDGFDMMGGSAIVSPQGEIVAQAYTLEDELITAKCDLDLCSFGKSTIFNFAEHRRPEHYRRIVDQVGVEEPAE